MRDYTPVQRDPRERDQTYLTFLRTQPCCIRGCRRRPAEAAHIRMTCQAYGKVNPGMQAKPHDRFAVPLCSWHHRNAPDAQHKGEEAAFWRRHRLNPFAIAEQLYAIGGGVATTAKPKRRYHPAAAKSRAIPRMPFCKGPSRKLQSRGFPKGRRGFSERRP